MAQAGRSGKPVFAVAPYEADADGVLRAVLPERCVLGSGMESCALFVDHYRDRKTGPRIPLAVVGCRVHRRGRYTLYPPGQVPYGRRPVVVCSASGGLLAEGARGGPPWEATVFAAAVDAAEGVRWPAESPWDDTRRRRTQGRGLERAARIVGVHPKQDERTRERIAARLGVAAMRLQSGARSWGVSWMARGTAVVSVLLALTFDGTLLDRLLTAGAVAGVWGPPSRWDGARGSWIAGRSEEPEWARPERARSRDPPPTNSPAAGEAAAELA